MPIIKKAAPTSTPERPRVLHIGPLPPPVGGMSTVLLELSAALQSDCETRVFSSAKTTPVDRSLLQAVGAQLRLIGRLALVLWRWRPAIVHIHTCSNFTFWRNGLDLMLARCFGCKTVLHIHGARFHQFLGGLGAVRAGLARVVLGGASRVIVLGQAWRERLAPWCRAESLVVVANGVAVPANALGPSDDAVAHIVCVANYEPRKGLHDLIRAAAELPADGRPWRISFLGADLDQAYQRSLRQLAKDLGVEDRVSLPGPVAAAQVADWLRSAYLFCLPSYDEGLPMSMLEAMGHALPVVATSVGAIPEAVDEGVEAFLYPPGDVAALAAALTRLLESPELARRMGESGHRRAALNYSAQSMAQRVFEVYQQMLGGGFTPAARL